MLRALRLAAEALHYICTRGPNEGGWRDSAVAICNGFIREVGNTPSRLDADFPRCTVTSPTRINLEKVTDTSRKSQFVTFSDLLVLQITAYVAWIV